MDYKPSTESLEIETGMLTLKKTNSGGYLAILAIISSFPESSPVPFPEGYTAEDFYHALEAIEILRKGFPEGKELHDKAAAFIRREWLHEKEATAHGQSA